jgi:hypothetical protein
VACGCGIFALLSLIKEKLKLFAIIAIILAFASNSYWIFSAADSIRHKTARRHEYNSPPAYFINELTKYIKSNPNTIFVPSKQIREDIFYFEKDLPSNIRLELKNQSDIFICYQSESTMLERKWPSTGQNYISKVIGPQVANMNYYSKFWGSEWIFLIPFKNFEFLPTFLSQLVNAIPPPPFEDRSTSARWGYTHGL